MSASGEARPVAMAVSGSIAMSPSMAGTVGEIASAAALQSGSSLAQDFAPGSPMAESRIHARPRYYKLECKEQNKDREMLDRLLNFHKSKAYDGTLRIVGGWLRDKILGTKREVVNLNVLIPSLNAEDYAKEFQEYLDMEFQQRTALRVTRQGLAILEEPESKLVIDFTPMTRNAAGVPDPVEDVKTKDFTINAMYWELEIQRIVDYCDGIKDINSHILRCPVSAKDAFAQNPLRSFRAVRFLSSFTGNQDFIADVSLVDALKKAGPQLKQYLGEESAYSEWEKVFADRRINMTKFCLLMAQYSLLDSMFDLGSAVGTGMKKEKIWAHGIRCVYLADAALAKICTSKTNVILPSVTFPGPTIYRDLRRFRATELGTLFLACLLGGIPSELRKKKVERYLSLQSTVVTEILDAARFPPPVTPKVILIQNLGEDMLNILRDPATYNDYAAIRMRVHNEEGCDETWEYAAVYAAVQFELTSGIQTARQPVAELTKQQVIDQLSKPLAEETVDSIDRNVNSLYNVVIKGNRPKIYTLAWEPHGSDESVLNHISKMVSEWEEPLIVRVAGDWVTDKFLGVRRELQKIDIVLETPEIEDFANKIVQYFNDVVHLMDVQPPFAVGPNSELYSEFKYKSAFRVVLPSWKIILDISSLRSPDSAFVGTVYQDARLRDFTVCSLIWNLQMHRIEDHVGGVQDIRSRTLRCCSQDALSTLLASDERILRALLILCAHPEVQPDEALVAAAPKTGEALVRAVQAGMFGRHWDKLFIEKRAHWGREFSLLAEWNLLSSLFVLPEDVTAKIAADKLFGAGLRAVQYVQQIWRRLNSNETVVQMGWETVFRKREKCSAEVAGTLFMGAFMLAFPAESVSAVLEDSLKISRSQVELIEFAIKWAQASVKAMNPKEEANRLSQSGALEAIMKNPEVGGHLGMSEIIIILSTVMQEMMAKNEFKAYTRATGAKLPVTDFEKDVLDKLELHVAENYDRLRKSFRPKAYNLKWPSHNSDQELFSRICGYMAEKDDTHKVRVVGGWMRDKILGIKRDTSDISFVLETLEVENWTQGLAEYLKKNQPELADSCIVSVGYTEGQYSGCKLEIEPWNLTCVFMPLKSEVEPGALGTPYQDVHLRELTVNAIMYNIHTDLIEDYCKGISDLEARILRTPGPPAKTLALEEFRLVRLVRFAATLSSFALSPELEKAVDVFVKNFIKGNKMPDHVDFQEELEKFFEDRRAEWPRAFELLAKWSLLDYMFDISGTASKVPTDKVWGAGLRCMQLVYASLQNLVYNNMKIPWPSDSKFRTHNKYGLKELGSLALATLMIAVPLENMKDVLSKSRLQPDVIERVIALRRVAATVCEALGTGSGSSTPYQPLYNMLEQDAEASETRDYAIILGCSSFHMIERLKELKEYSRTKGAEACVTPLDAETLELLEVDLTAIFKGLARMGRHSRGITAVLGTNSPAMLQSSFNTIPDPPTALTTERQA